MKPQPFKSWVKTYGVRRLATELDIDMSTIRKWRQGHCPSPVLMRAIVRKSRGRVSYANIIDEVIGG